MTTKRVAIYGGSFNPPHVGHVLVVSYVLATSNVDAVWLVPCYQHAFSKALVPFEKRLEMTRIAISHFGPSYANVSDVEARIGGVSRTIDTIRRLQVEEPDIQFDLVVGADIFQDRASWKSFDELEQLCRFIVIGRDGYPSPPDHPAAPALFDVSSTTILDAVRTKKPTTTLLPAQVRAYIDKHELYR